VFVGIPANSIVTGLEHCADRRNSFLDAVIIV